MDDDAIYGSSTRSSQVSRLTMAQQARIDTLIGNLDTRIDDALDGLSKQEGLTDAQKAALRSPESSIPHIFRNQLRLAFTRPGPTTNIQLRSMLNASKRDVTEILSHEESDAGLRLLLNAAYAKLCTTLAVEVKTCGVTAGRQFH